MILKDPISLIFRYKTIDIWKKDLEDAILRSIEQFIFELGVGFSFIERQKNYYRW